MSSKIQSLSGVFDILPKSVEPWRSSAVWQNVENIARKCASDFNFKEIRTPVIEPAELFQRSVGETSDIVKKEMFIFNDLKNRNISLRPEGTAAVMRAFIENRLYPAEKVHRFYYIGPMFRNERQQLGRYKQHHQLGAEVIGVSAPEQDAESIAFLSTFYDRLGLKNLTVHLNSLGGVTTRQEYKKSLSTFFKGHFHALSPNSQSILESNPLRILDSKDDVDKKIIKAAPLLIDSLSPEEIRRFEVVKECLLAIGIPFEVNPTLVRGLDYYNETVFEVVHHESEKSVGGGGRYDGLLKTMGGPDLPAVGFGTGLERVIQLMIKQNIPLPIDPPPSLYLIPLGERAVRQCFLAAQDLRKRGYSVLVDYDDPLKRAMQKAAQLNARFVGVIGDNELQSGIVNLKEMSTGQTQAVPFEFIPKHL